MSEQVMDQAEEKYRLNSGWILHPLRLKDDRIIHANLSESNRKRVRNTAVLCHVILANSFLLGSLHYLHCSGLLRSRGRLTLQRLTDQLDVITSMT